MGRGRRQGREADKTASMRLGKVPSGILTFVKALECVLCVEEVAVGGVGAGERSVETKKGPEPGGA